MATLRQEARIKYQNSILDTLPTRCITEIEENSELLSILNKHASPTVYIVKCHNFYKIGFTAMSMETRFVSMQNGNPYKLELAFAIKTENAEILEKDLHTLFAHKRVRGEWFSLVGNDWKILEDYINALWLPLNNAKL